MFRIILALAIAALITGGDAVAAPKKKAGGASQKNELQNTERELVDALQSMHRNSKGKPRLKAKTKTK